MRRKTVLVTGGAGFIGSHLCERLLAEDFKVICLDNFITGSVENLEDIKDNPHLKFIKHDISKSVKVKGRLDYVLHFASPASPDDYLKFSIQTLKVGSLGTHNALGLAKEKKAGFMLASTSEVYGDPLVHPQTETYWGNVNPVGLRGCYDEAKRFAEAMTMAYHRKHSMDIRILRIFNTYGPRMRMNDGRVVPNFIYQALAGKPLTIYGKGTQTRSFCYVDDLIEGIFRLMISKITQPMNLGNPDEFTIMELAQLICRITGKDLKFSFKPLPEDDPKQRRPDISFARKTLKWEPAIKLESGLKKTIDWFSAKVKPAAARRK